MWLNNTMTLSDQGGSLKQLRHELEAANQGLENVRPQLARAKHVARLHLLMERIGSHIHAWYSHAYSWTFTHWKCMTSVGEMMRGLKQTIQQSQIVLKQITSNPNIMRQLQSVGPMHPQEEPSIENDWMENFKILTQATIQAVTTRSSPARNKRALQATTNMPQHDLTNTEEEEFRAMAKKCANDQRSFVVQAKAHAKLSVDFLKDPKNLAVVQEVYSEMIEEHKTAISKERKSGEWRKARQSKEVAAVAEQAWCSDLLSNPNDSLVSPSIGEAANEVREHQTTVSSYEARAQLERFLTKQLFKKAPRAGVQK